MKRFIAATVAAATAVSLSAGVASAQSADLSSDKVSTDTAVDFFQNIGEAVEIAAKYPNSDTAKKQRTSSYELRNDAFASSIENSSQDTQLSAGNAYWDVAKSSYENDYKQGWALGSTADAIIGVAATLAILAGLYNYAQANGIALPALPALNF